MTKSDNLNITHIGCDVKSCYTSTMKPTTDMLVWVSNNRGKLTAIADQAKCSPQFVHLVLRGERSSKTGIVEKLLREYGAPITDTEAAPV